MQLEDLKKAIISLSNAPLQSGLLNLHLRCNITPKPYECQA
jgi:hypothetical protein